MSKVQLYLSYTMNTIYTETAKFDIQIRTLMSYVNLDMIFFL